MSEKQRDRVVQICPDIDGDAFNQRRRKSRKGGDTGGCVVAYIIVDQTTRGYVYRGRWGSFRIELHNSPRDFRRGGFKSFHAMKAFVENWYAKGNAAVGYGG